MERIKREDLELLFGKMLTEKELTILGFKNPLKFEIYDGFAYCPNYRGSEYCMQYPKCEFVEKSTEMQEDIRRNSGIAEGVEITVCDILSNYNEMSRDGIRIEFDKKTKHFKEKLIWK